MLSLLSVSWTSWICGLIIVSSNLENFCHYIVIFLNFDSSHVACILGHLTLSHSLLVAAAYVSPSCFLSIWHFWIFYYSVFKFIDFSFAMSDLLISPSVFFIWDFLYFNQFDFFPYVFAQHVQSFLLVFTHKNYSYSSCLNALVYWVYYLCQFSTDWFFSLWHVFSYSFFFCAC